MRFALLLLSLSAACASAPSSSPARIDMDGARAAHANYVAAINSNQLEPLLEMLTDDVVFLAPNTAPMIGKPALIPWLAGYYEAFETHWDKPVQEFVLCGEWAFERYSYIGTDTPRAGGDPIQSTGWGLVIYHHDADGKWRVARDSWGSDQPAN